MKRVKWINVWDKIPFLHSGLKSEMINNKLYVYPWPTTNAKVNVF